MRLSAARAEHLLQRAPFVPCCSEAPGAFDAGPGSGVAAPVTAAPRTPELRPPIAFHPVDGGLNGQQVVGVADIIRKTFLFGRGPSPAAGPMRVGERHKMIDVKLRCSCRRISCVSTDPSSAVYRATTRLAK